jgi:hypothetical protein
MARRSPESMDYLRAIETLSESEETLQNAVRRPGPGGEAYEHTPTPGPPKPQKGILSKLGERARQMVSGVTWTPAKPKRLAFKTSKEMERLQTRAGVFLKHNALLFAGIAAFGASLFAARKFWRSR